MIQIDMKMPTNCLECPACNEYLTCAIPINGRKWGENDVRDFSQSRPEWCPMKEQDTVEYACDILRANGWKETEPLCSECDAVHVVLCKDCKKRNSWECWQYFFGRIKIPDDLFCADGERSS